MAVTDEYKKMKDMSKIEVFTELFELKDKKTAIDKRIKELEAEYKPFVSQSKEDLFFELPSGMKFSIKKSMRKGNINTELMESDGIDADQYRNKDSEVWTLRKDK